MAAASTVCHGARLGLHDVLALLPGLSTSVDVISLCYSARSFLHPVVMESSAALAQVVKEMVPVVFGVR